MTNGNSMTLTLSGYQNHIIKGIVLSMKSNASGGKGYMSAVAGGSTTIASFGSSESDKTFNGDWYTGWSTSYVDIPITLSDYNYEVQNENIVITINATANSLYCQSFTILYELTTTPVINASDVEIAASETSGEIAYTISNPDGSTLTAEEKAPGYDWIDAVTVVVAENKVTFTTTENTGASRVGYITLTYGSVTKDVKVTQAAPVYTVTCATGLENGSIEASPTTAAEGETITINATPIDSDVYALISVTVTKASDSSPVSVVKTGNTATFTMPADNVNVTATFGPIPDYVDLPFNWAGGTKAELNAVSGVTVNADDDYAASNAPYRIKFNTEGHYIAIKTNEQIGAVSVGIKKFASGNASILKIEGSVDGTTYSEIQQFTISGAQNATFKYYTTAAFDADYRHVRIYFNRPDSGGSNIGVGPIVVRSIESFSLSIGGYGDNDNVKTGWNLIASPIVSTTPVGVTNMLSNNYDLYRFNQSAEKEWENYKASNFSIASGQGYLYANSEDVELTFTGIPYLGDGNVTLTKVDGKEFSGWNLVGNPFNANVTITPDYYRMNTAGDGFELVSNGAAVKRMEGIFVYTDTDGTTLTFTASAKGNTKANNQLSFSLSNNNKTIDRAVVRFGESNTLPKLRLMQGCAEVYIPQNGKDYAIVCSEGQGEMPINFKAEKNGSYTLSIDIEADMDYLHLIDNMTGADVDLLANPSYTFDARTSDYASRFRLLFSANTVDDNTSTGSATFAYFNGSEWVVNSNGNATLQVVDVMGRVLSSETVNGNHTMNLNLSTGVYMLRLVNGNDVKTQKIVVR